VARPPRSIARQATIESVERAADRGGPMMRAMRDAVASFRAHKGMFLASGLAFNFMVCLIPLLFFLISLAGFVLTRRAAADAVLDQLSQIVPVYKSELRAMLAHVVRRRGLSGLVGTAVLLLFASQLFAGLRLVLNQVFGVTRDPGFVRGLVKDFALLFAMGVLFLASIAITDLFGWIRLFLAAPTAVPRQWVRAGFIALALAFNTGLFFVAYRYFPHRKVAASAALLGALLASVLWEAAKQLFRWYIVTLGPYDKIYGPLGALVALSMFTYYSGIVFVLGAEFAAAVSRGRRER
jgi:membrane protein